MPASGLSLRKRRAMMIEPVSARSEVMLAPSVSINTTGCRLVPRCRSRFRRASAGCRRIPATSLRQVDHRAFEHVGGCVLAHRHAEIDDDFARELRARTTLQSVGRARELAAPEATQVERDDDDRGVDLRARAFVTTAEFREVAAAADDALGEQAHDFAVLQRGRNLVERAATRGTAGNRNRARTG